MNFQEKRVFITGASKGLGLVCAREFARRGARLALVARSTDLLETARESCDGRGRHICITSDFFNSGEAGHAAEAALNSLDGVDVIIHAAGGGLGMRDPLLSSAEFDKLIAVNLRACVEINKILIPGMMQRKSGNVVHVGSIASTQAVGSVGYNTAKAALAAYVRTLGREAATAGIIITGILPGGFLAPSNAMERLEKNNPGAYSAFLSERLPRKFMGRAEELIPMITLLASPAASMMGGCMVPIDAGEGIDYTA